jgi:hypothetical protein
MWLCEGWNIKMKHGKEMRMADLCVMEINGRMEQVKILCTKAELWLRGWNVKSMSCGIFYESEDYIQVKIFKGRGWGFMCWECGLRMSGGFLVKLVWLMCLGQGLWSFCDCWTLCFGLSSFLLRKDWLTTSTPKLDDVPIIQTKEKPILMGEW